MAGWLAIVLGLFAFPLSALTEPHVYLINRSALFPVALAAIAPLAVPGSIEAAQRKAGFTHGVFEWLRKAPWGNPAFSGMFMSLVMFGFLGGISGVILGTEQLNIMMHNTL